MYFDSKYHVKRRSASTFMQIITINYLFPFEVAQKCQKCVLYVVREKSVVHQNHLSEKPINEKNMLSNIFKVSLFRVDQFVKFGEKLSDWMGGKYH